jgi:cell division protein FtsW (lipid II flippase)
LSIAVVLLVWFTRELIAAALTTSAGMGRSVAAAVVVLLPSSITLTLTWLVGLSPLLGLPLPTLARGGSHLIVYATALGLLDAVSAAQRDTT